MKKLLLLIVLISIPSWAVEETPSKLKVFVTVKQEPPPKEGAVAAARLISQALTGRAEFETVDVQASADLTVVGLNRVRFGPNAAGAAVGVLVYLRDGLIVPMFGKDLESETLAAKDAVMQLATFAKINHQKLLAMR